MLTRHAGTSRGSELASKEGVRRGEGEVELDERERVGGDSVGLTCWMGMKGQGVSCGPEVMLAWGSTDMRRSTWTTEVEKEAAIRHAPQG